MQKFQSQPDWSFVHFYRIGIIINRNVYFVCAGNVHIYTALSFLICYNYLSSSIITQFNESLNELDFREPNEPWFKNHLKSIWHMFPP